MTIEKFLSMLTGSSLFLCRCDQFEDKAELLVSDIEREYYNSLTPGFLKSIERLRKRFFISCWIKNENEVSTMWGAFASSSSGIAIKTNIGRLKMCYHGKRELELFDVRYINHKTEMVQPLIDRTNDYYYFITKRQFYRSENECKHSVNPVLAV